MSSVLMSLGWRRAAALTVVLSYCGLFIVAAAKEAITAEMTGAGKLGITILSERWLLFAAVACALLIPRRMFVWPDMARWERIALAGAALVLIATTALVADNPIWGFLVLVPPLAAITLIPAVASLASDPRASWTPGLLMAVPAIAAILSIPGAVHAHLTLGFPEYFGFVFAPGVGGLRVYGHVLAAGIAGLSGLMICEQARGKTVFMAIALTGLWLMIGLSGSRGGVMSLVISLAVLFLVAAQARRRWAWWSLPAVLGIALSAAYDMGQPEFNVIKSFLETVSTVSDGGDPSSHRIGIWAQAVDLIRASPIFGHGYGQAILLVTWPTVPQPHVHNLVLEIGLATGLPTLIVVLILSALWWTRATALVRAYPGAIPAWLTLTTMLVFGLVSGTYFHAEGLFPMALATGVLIALAKQGKHS